MIGFLRGTVHEIFEDSVILDVGGVGYELTLSQNSLVEMVLGEAIEFYVYTHVREDQFSLYGFLSKTEKQLFLSLLKVNGIGPKMAIQVLSGAPLDRIIGFISEGDVKGLTTLPKVGKKTAEQMILSLKGKLVMDEPMSAVIKSPVKDQIQSALVNLGFKALDVEKLVAEMDEKIDVQDGIRKGLQILSNQN